VSDTFFVGLLVISAALGEPSQAQFRAARQDVMSMYLYNGRDEATFKKNLEQQTDLKIEQISRLVQLDEAQLEKLELAAHGDLSRFYRELERIREQVKGFSPENGNDMQQAWQVISPLQQRIAAGIFDENSLLERVLCTLLSPEQHQTYRAGQRERQLYRYKSVLRMTIADLEKALPLTAKQRTELIKLVEEKNFPRACPQNLESYVGYAMLARLSEQETKELLDAEQHKTFHQLSLQYAQFMNNFTW